MAELLSRSGDSPQAGPKLLAEDTPLEVEAVQLELLRQTPVWRRLEMVGELNEAMRMLALSGLRQRHPGASPAELHRHLADLYLGPELAERVYGPLVPTELDKSKTTL